MPNLLRPPPRPAVFSCTPCPPADASEIQVKTLVCAVAMRDVTPKRDTGQICHILFANAIGMTLLMAVFPSLTITSIKPHTDFFDDVTFHFLHHPVNTMPIDIITNDRMAANTTSNKIT